MNSLKLRIAHMVEKGQTIWQQRDMSELLGQKVPDGLFFMKKSEKYIYVYSLKKIF